jgi:two-component system LytT family response regulator
VRVLIVDDEPHARAKLRRMLGMYDDIEVVGEAADGMSALQRCIEHSPDAVFLDMQMPEMDGFGVVERLPVPRPAIILVTAFEEHALRAFDAEITDYLLKPVAGDRLERTVRRLRALRDAPQATLQAPTPAKLLVADRGKVHVVDPESIEWLEAADNYVHVHTGGRSYLLRRTLRLLLDELGPRFVRVHRCFAIPIDRVCAVESRGKGDAVVLLRDGRQIPCSRQHKSSLLALLQPRADDLAIAPSR